MFNYINTHHLDEVEALADDQVNWPRSFYQHVLEDKQWLIPIIKTKNPSCV